MFQNFQIRTFVLAFFTLVGVTLVGCSKGKKSEEDTEQKITCIPSEVEGGLEFTCSNGKVYRQKNGQDGKNGKPGEKGEKGEKGDKGDPGQDGKDGNDGKNGEDGQNGQDGSGCTIEETETELVFTCGEKQYRIPKGQVEPGENPLLKPSSLEYGAYQWDKIQPAHMIPAIKIGIIQSKKIFDEVVNDAAEPTFANTIEKLELAESVFDRAIYAFFSVSGLLQEQYQPLRAEINALMNDLETHMKNKNYHAKIKSLYDQREGLELTPLQQRMLETKYEEQVRNGLALSEDKIKQVSEIDLKISNLQAKFGENSVKSKETFNLHIENLEDLKGVPERVIQAAAVRAKDQDKSGYVLNLDTSLWVEILNNAENRELRKLYFLARQRIAYGQGPLPGYDGSEFDNREIIVEIAKLRRERAQILGFKNHAEWKLQDKMASDPKTVMDFMDGLLEPVKEQAKKEIALLFDFQTQKVGPKETQPIEPWDVRYWAERYRQEKLGVESEKIRQHFELNRVLNDGVFFQGEQFWGFSFKERQDLPTFHENVRVYEAKDEKGQTRGILYLDLFARKGKRSGAWMSSVRDRSEKQPVAIIHVALNLPKPTGDAPALLSIDEAETLFHEFGHAYHVLLSDVKYASMAGANVAWDFVEVPSQVPEAFVQQKDVLKNYAKHVETGEVIPDELIEQVVNSKKFMIGGFELRQMRLAYIDMAWYLEEELPAAKDVGAFEKLAVQKATILPFEDEIGMGASFGHIFAGGYDSGYYGYQWARVIGADLFAAFTEDGGFTMEKAKPLAKKLRETILSQGNSAHPATLFKNFRGRDYKKDFFLESLKSGIDSDNDDSADIPRYYLQRAI